MMLTRVAQVRQQSSQQKQRDESHGAVGRVTVLLEEEAEFKKEFGSQKIFMSRYEGRHVREEQMETLLSSGTTHHRPEGVWLRDSP